jgi:hypothetical protein
LKTFDPTTTPAPTVCWWCRSAATGLSPPCSLALRVGANGLTDRHRASLSFAGRARWCLLGQAGLGPRFVGWDVGAGARRHRAKQVDAVAGVEGDARVGVAQRVVVQDRDRDPAWRPGGLAKCVADGG